MKEVGKFLNDTTSLGGRAHPMLARFIRYVLTAGSASAVDIVILILLVEIFNLFYLYAATISFVVASTLNYILSRRWGFKGTKTGHAEGYPIFIGFSAVSLGLTIFFLELLVDDLGWHYIPAKIVIAVLLGTVNFFIHYYLTFKLHLRGKKAN